MSGTAKKTSVPGLTASSALQAERTDSAAMLGGGGRGNHGPRLDLEVDPRRSVAP